VPPVPAPAEPRETRPLPVFGIYTTPNPATKTSLKINRFGSERNLFKEENHAQAEENQAKSKFYKKAPFVFFGL